MTLWAAVEEQIKSRKVKGEITPELWIDGGPWGIEV